ncbi:hypothetical protein MMUC44124_24120 [Mycolicibacterium mucogenicum DSM 44124]|uniref:Uncharacterized protein n=1 Tax=Mycolicibacterium mucogenicum DSM 44124 TaxID=1226753 RepID=A0A8H2PJ55_MYCMU|nr:hypothetical protein MMUC44124_24120 [Mycolicibacterium mucogenicum DSM 44124]
MISERQEPDGTRVWLLGDNMVLRAVPKFEQLESWAGSRPSRPMRPIGDLMWKVTMFGVNGITADVMVADADLPLTVNCWCTLVVAAADGRLDEC